jgi:hypothetical protein
MREEERGCGYFRIPGPGLKKYFRVTFHGFTKTVTLRQRSIIPERPTAHGVLGQTL